MSAAGDWSPTRFWSASLALCILAAGAGHAIAPRGDMHPAVSASFYFGYGMGGLLMAGGPIYLLTKRRRPAWIAAAILSGTLVASAAIHPPPGPPAKEEPAARGAPLF